MSKFEEEFADFFLMKRLIFIRNDKKLIGTPDFSFYNGSIALFLHGCFWHGHNCVENNLDKIWRSKINCIINKDFIVRQNYLASKMRYIRVWECEYIDNKTKILDKVYNQIMYL